MSLPVKPPAGLRAAGKRAWAEVLERAPAATTAAALRYCRAVEVADQAWSEWRRAKRPIPSPLLVAAERADAAAARYAIACGLERRPDATGRAPGRPLGGRGHVPPDRQSSAPAGRDEPPRVTR